MSTVSPTRQTVVMLPSSRRSILVVVDYDDPAALPVTADVLLCVCRDNLDDAIALGEQIVEMLQAGEAVQWAASMHADRREP